MYSSLVTSAPHSDSVPDAGASVRCGPLCRLPACRWRPCNGRVGLSQNGEPPHSHAAYVESSEPLRFAAMARLQT
jgi:hypothetical protein